MTRATALDPLASTLRLRTFGYDSIVLAWEVDRARVTKATFDRKWLSDSIGFDFTNLKTLPEVKEAESQNCEDQEFLVFHIDSKGYECLAKRLRDTFAHGHYEETTKGMVTIRHRFKGRNDKVPMTRIFGRIRVANLKRLIGFLYATPGQGGSVS